MYVYQNHINKNLTATTTEGNIELNIKKVSSISNRSTTTNLIVNFNSNIGQNDYIIIEPSTSIDFDDNEEASCDTLYYKSESGSVDFQITGFTKIGIYPNV